MGCEAHEGNGTFSAPPPSSNPRSCRVQRTMTTEASGTHDGIVYRVLIFSKILLQKLSKSESTSRTYTGLPCFSFSPACRS